MFSGIVEAIGSIRTLERRSGGVGVVIATPFRADDVQIGDSVACDGICLTVCAIDKTSKGSCLAFDLSEQTLLRTQAREWKKDRPLNLERALVLGSRLGGHFVFGHVDEVVRLERRIVAERSTRFDLNMPTELAPFICERGSLALNGVSLTVAETSNETFSVFLIPQSLKTTTFANLKVGDALNLEVDMMARYVQRAVRFAK